MRRPFRCLIQIDFLLILSAAFRSAAIKHLRLKLGVKLPFRRTFKGQCACKGPHQRRLHNSFRTLAQCLPE